MLTLATILRAAKLAASYGDDGAHYFDGRHERQNRSPAPAPSSSSQGPTVTLRVERDDAAGKFRVTPVK